MHFNLPSRLKNYLQPGFTLIELMLVILVVSLLTVYGVKIINTSVMNNQINRAVTQVTEIQQALTNYYIGNNSDWPSDLSDIAGTSSNSYLPLNALCSPFIHTGSNNNCGNYAAYLGQKPNNTQYYTLKVTLPSAATADQLLAALPNSWLSGNSTVNIAVLPPVSTTPANHGWIVSAGAIAFLNEDSGSNTHDAGGWGSHNLNPNNYYSTATQVYLPNCPAGYEGHIFFSPEYYETEAVLQQKPGIPSGFPTNPKVDDYGEVMHLAQALAGSSNSQIHSFGDNTSMSFGQSVVNTVTSAAQGFSTQAGIGYTYNTTLGIGWVETDNNGHTGYNVLTADVPDQAYATQQHTLSPVMHTAFYLTMCIPVNHWNNNALWQLWPQDGQCSASWISYLQRQENPGSTLPPLPIQCDASKNLYLYDCSGTDFPQAAMKGTKSCTMAPGPSNNIDTLQADAY